jgi:hypothetical protein
MNAAWNETVTEDASKKQLFQSLLGQFSLAN